MADPALIKRWKIVETHLILARHSLATMGFEWTAPEADRLREFDEYIAANELELAMSVLSDVGLEQECRGRFWRELERAALAMGLESEAAEFSRRFAQTIKAR